MIIERMSLSDLSIHKSEGGEHEVDPILPLSDRHWRGVEIGKTLIFEKQGGTKNRFFYNPMSLVSWGGEGVV